MKATGIVRRIDDLGRVVIPKEIRRTMRIREGDPLEIFTDREGEVIFKKYSPIGELQDFSAQYAETLFKTCSMAVIICDRDSVIACAGLSKKDYVDHRLSDDIEKIMSKRTIYLKGDDAEEIRVTPNGAAFISCAMPIIMGGDTTGGDIAGCVASVYIPDGNPSRFHSPELEAKLIQTAADFLGRQLES